MSHRGAVQFATEPVSRQQSEGENFQMFLQLKNQKWILRPVVYTEQRSRDSQTIDKEGDDADDLFAEVMGS
jgi:hypothetical protein